MTSIRSPISKPASLSELLRKRRWIDPKASLGDHVMIHKGYTFWDPQGPALSTWHTLKADLDKFLVDKASPNVRWTCYMSGQTEATAAPTVIFIGQETGGRRTQKLARVILKQDQYVGFRSLLLGFDPGMKNLVPFTISSIPFDTAHGPDMQSGWRIFSSKSVGVWQHRHTLQCVLTYDDGERQSRGVLSGSFQVRGQRVFLTSAHILTGRTPLHVESSAIECNGALLAFDSAVDGTDENVDDRDDDQEMLVDFTSHGSISSPGSDSDDSSAQSDLATLPAMQSQPQEPARPADEPNLQSQQPIFSLPLTDYEHIPWPAEHFEVFIGSEHLDYALLMVPRSVMAGIFTETDLLLHSLGAEHNRDTGDRVWVGNSAAAAAYGSLRGHTVTFKPAQSDKVQELLTYNPIPSLESRPALNWLQPGDSGALIYNADRSQLYGHVIAGDPSTGQAYVIPIQDVRNDVENNFDPLQRPSYREVDRVRNEIADVHTLETLLDFGHSWLDDFAASSTVVRPTTPFGDRYDFIPAANRIKSTLSATAPPFVPEQQRQCPQSSGSDLSIDAMQSEHRHRMSSLTPPQTDMAFGYKDLPRSSLLQQGLDDPGNISGYDNIHGTLFHPHFGQAYQRSFWELPALDGIDSWAQSTQDHVDPARLTPPTPLSPRSPTNHGSELSSRASSKSRPDSGLYLCDHEGCGKTFHSSTEFTHHKRNHGERHHVCSSCSKKFVFRKDLGRHERTHHGERKSFGPIVEDCQWCIAGFQGKDHYQRHMLRHTSSSASAAATESHDGRSSALFPTK